MTDKLHISLILLITLVVLVIACWKCQSTQAATGAYIVGCILLYRFCIWISGRLDKAEAKENSKPL